MVNTFVIFLLPGKVEIEEQKYFSEIGIKNTMVIFTENVKYWPIMYMRCV